MMGVNGRPQASPKPNKIAPLLAHGVKLMSLGFLTDANTPMIWRGPMVHGAVSQLLRETDWEELDYLIVDLPPGTGDVPLTLSQSIPMTGAVVVCTPQDVALLDATRAIKMYQQLNVPCIGMIENMSYYICPQCGNRDEIFDHGGAARTAEELKVPFLGGIPLNVKIRKYGDEGTPFKNFTEADDSVLQAVQNVVRATAGKISVMNMLQVAQPSLTIE